MKYLFFILVCLSLTINPARAQLQSSVFLADHTWPEVRDKIAAGYITIIVPTGGTEQNGPHLALDKHNTIVTYASAEIAKNLGRTLVAPTIPYVPSGRIAPPEGHMRFPGTISLRDETMVAILEDTARSLKEHGFINIILLGDHGGTQPAMQRIAQRLSTEWQSMPNQVIHIPDYYQNNGQEEWAARQNIGLNNIKAHGGFADTAQVMTIDPRQVRRNLIRSYNHQTASTLGVAGDPSKATDQYGAQLLRLKVGAATEQIRGMLH